MSLYLQHPPPTQPRRRRRRPLVWLVVCTSALLAAAVAVAVVLVSPLGKHKSRSVAIVPIRAAADRGLDVVPFPGTPDASPTTQITFPALLPSEIEAVTVTGSRSGRHAGRLVALPGRRGTAFAPYKSFSSGERVT